MGPINSVSEVFARGKPYTADRSGGGSGGGLVSGVRGGGRKLWKTGQQTAVSGLVNSGQTSGKNALVHARQRNVRARKHICRKISREHAELSLSLRFFSRTVYFTPSLKRATKKNKEKKHLETTIFPPKKKNNNKRNCFRSVCVGGERFVRDRLFVSADGEMRGKRNKSRFRNQIFPIQRSEHDGDNGGGPRKTRTTPFLVKVLMLTVFESKTDHDFNDCIR